MSSLKTILEKVVVMLWYSVCSHSTWVNNSSSLYNLARRNLFIFLPHHSSSIRCNVVVYFPILKSLIECWTATRFLDPHLMWPKRVCVCVHTHWYRTSIASIATRGLFLPHASSSKEQLSPTDGIKHCFWGYVQVNISTACID